MLFLQSLKWENFKYFYIIVNPKLRLSAYCKEGGGVEG
jgi:hypothetical protein